VNRLSKDQLAARETIVTRLNSAGEAVTDAVNAYNEAMAAEWAKVEEAIADYNAAVESANEFRDGVHADMEGYYEDRSEKWQEGEKGSAYSDWMNEWDEYFSELEVDPPNPVDEPDLGEADALADLPEVPS
jgi:hypothetical protein